VIALLFNCVCLTRATTEDATEEQVDILHFLTETRQ